MEFGTWVRQKKQSGSLPGKEKTEQTAGQVVQFQRKPGQEYDRMATPHLSATAGTENTFGSWVRQKKREGTLELPSTGKTQWVDNIRPYKGQGQAAGGGERTQEKWTGRFAQPVGPDRYGRTPGPAVSKRRPQGGSATGEYTAVVKGLRETGERLETGVKELEELKTVYDASPSAERAQTYNSRLAQLQRDQAEYDKLVERYGYFTTAEGLKERIDEMRPVAEAAQREHDEARAARAGAETYRDMAAGKQRVEASEKGLERVKDYNDLLGLYYEAENEKKAAALRGDKGALEKYATARTLEEDMAKVQALMGLADLPTSKSVEEDRRYIQEKYGLDDGAVRRDPTLRELYLELKAQQARTVEELGEAEYDYGRMERYARMKADREEYTQKQAQWQQFAQEHPWISSTATVAASPFQGIDALRLLKDGWGHSDDSDLAHYEPANIYGMDTTNFVGTVRGTVAEKIEKNTDWELFGQNVASFAYQTGMSIADSATQVAAMGSAATLFMGASAAANQAKSVIQRGGTNRQAFWGGLASGAAEAIFEYVSIDKLLSPKNVGSIKDLLRETVKQAGVEASEEMFTEVANILSDAAVMGQQSDFAQAVQAYMEDEGLSREEARRRAFLDCVGQVALAGAGGALSGGVMGGAVSAVNYAGGKLNASGTLSEGQKVTAPETGAVKADTSRPRFSGESWTPGRASPPPSWATSTTLCAGSPPSGGIRRGRLVTLEGGRRKAKALKLKRPPVAR